MALILLLKVCASSLSLGSGFRGGLFFSSLFMGSLLGKLFAGLAGSVVPWLALDPVIAAVVGMSALAVGVVGGPFTMTFLTLEITATCILRASCSPPPSAARCWCARPSATLLHLAHASAGGNHPQRAGCGWLRALTVERMMRTDVSVFGAGADLAAFRAAFPLGSVKTVALQDGEGRYVGLVPVAVAHSDAHPPTSGSRHWPATATTSCWRT